MSSLVNVSADAEMSDKVDRKKAYKNDIYKKNNIYNNNEVE